MFSTTLITATALVLSGLLLAATLLRSKLRPLLRRAR